MNGRARLVLFVGLVLAIAGCEPQSSAPPAAPAPPPPPPASVATDAEPAPPPGAPREEEVPVGPIHRESGPPPVLTPPFGGEGVLLDHYDYGGIGGFGDRVRIVGDDATLFHFSDTVATARLTPEEAQALAAILAAQAPVQRQSDDGDMPDGQSTGFFLAGRGTGKDLGEALRLIARLTARLNAVAPPR